MSSKKKKDNEVGYKRPPVSGRFSATNQLKRPPHYARPKGKTISEIEQEVHDFVGADGIPRRMTVKEIMFEKRIDAARDGNVAAMRKLFADLDAEQDEMAMKALPISKKHYRDALSHLKKILRRHAQVDAQLRSLGLITVMNGRRVVSMQARTACAQRDEELPKHSSASQSGK